MVTPILIDTSAHNDSDEEDDSDDDEGTLAGYCHFN